MTLTKRLEKIESMLPSGGDIHHEIDITVRGSSELSEQFRRVYKPIPEITTGDGYTVKIRYIDTGADLKK